MADTNVAAVDPGTATPQAPSGGGNTPVAGTLAPASDKSYSYKEDRTDWVPRTRLNEESAQRKRLEQQYADLNTRLEEQDGRIKKVFGVNTPSKEEADAAEIREHLYKIVPGLKHLENFSPEQLEDIREAAEASRTTSQATWQRHAVEMVNALEEHVAKAMGMDELTPSQKKRVHGAYKDEVAAAYNARRQADKTGAAYDASNDALARHERGDKSLVKEVAKAFLDDWYEPARRQISATTLQRTGRPVPSGGRSRSALTTKEPEVDLSNDEAFKKAIIAARADRQSA